MARTCEIDWGTAIVDRGDVTVELNAAASKEWREHFDAVLRLLSRENGAWGAVGVSKKAIDVHGVQPGAEDDLRHFLESVVVQVNSELAPAEESDEQARASAEEDPQRVADREMSETLRSFADERDR